MKNLFRAIIVCVLSICIFSCSKENNNTESESAYTEKEQSFLSSINGNWLYTNQVKIGNKTILVNTEKMEIKTYSKPVENVKSNGAYTVRVGELYLTSYDADGKVISERTKYTFRFEQVYSSSYAVLTMFHNDGSEFGTDWTCSLKDSNNLHISYKGVLTAITTKDFVRQ